MRLFKFLVIPNKLIENSEMIRPVLRIRLSEKKNREGYRMPKVISTKNEFFFYGSDFKEIDTEYLTQYNVVGSKKGMVLMSVDYPNENTEFSNNNKAYVVLDSHAFDNENIQVNNIDEVMNLISPVEYRNKSKFQGCYITDCRSCVKLSESCRNKNISIDIDSGKRYIRGKTWNSVNDTRGTRHKITQNLDGIITNNKEIEPRTGGIVYSCLQWEKGNRPDDLKNSVYVPLHHWIKCKSIPDENSKCSFYHLGHTFDCRAEFIGVGDKEIQKKIREEEEPKLNIYRGMRVLGGQNYYSTVINCTCSSGYIDKPKCRECKGVLYIQNEAELYNLYNQLTSDEYKKLTQ